jgi:hypothetical protein
MQSWARDLILTRLFFNENLAVLLIFLHESSKYSDR